MKITLTQDVDKVGRLGDTIDVKDGFAINWLIPRALAVRAESRQGKHLSNKRVYLDKKITVAAPPPTPKRVARTSERQKKDLKKVAQFRRKVGTPTTEQ